MTVKLSPIAEVGNSSAVEVAFLLQLKSFRHQEKGSCNTSIHGTCGGSHIGENNNTALVAFSKSISSLGPLLFSL